MTKTVKIEDISSIQVAIDMTRNGDEIVVEANGEPQIKITPFEKRVVKERILGLGEGKAYFMSDDFDDELPDKFWGFDKEL